MKLNEKLIKLRKEHGLSQEEFGYKINVSRQAVSKWESEQAVPEVDKIKEIGKVFNISYDYLLNDELDEIPEITSQEKMENSKKGSVILKVILILFLVYLIVCLYKCIVLIRFYKIANSFSEENYWMSQEWETDMGKMEHSIEKVGNKKIELSSNFSYEENKEPHRISYLDIDKKLCFDLVYDEEKDNYHYEDYIESAIVNDELDEVLKITNDIKENTLTLIPSSFKEILLCSINPLCRVSVKNKEIYTNDLKGTKIEIILTDDYLVHSYIRRSDFIGNLKLIYSYDYVPEHFNNDIENPIETYKDKIEYQIQEN